MHPLSKHQLLHKLMVLLPPKLMVLLPPKRLLLLPKLKLLMLSCPQFHLASKVNKIGIGNGRKKSIVWNHFEKLKIEEDVTKAVCNYFKKSYHIDSKSYGTSNLLAYVS